MSGSKTTDIRHATVTFAAFRWIGLWVGVTRRAAGLLRKTPRR